MPGATDCYPDTLLSVDQARDRLLRALGPVTAVETVALDAADGRVLARDVVAARSLPPFAQAAMDGYALDHRDVAGAAGPVRLPLSGRIAAGDAPGPLVPGTAVRIFTGAPLPEGADTVLMQEDADLDGDVLLAPPGLAPGRHCRAVGEDIAAGAVALPAGRRLSPAAVALAAALGEQGLAVRAPLTVALLSTGNEVRPAGAPLPPGAIHDANGPLLTALLRRLGCRVVPAGIVGDDPAALAATLSSLTADLILSSGGVSAGEEDHVKAAVAALGGIDFWRLALKPGKPLAFGHVGNTPFLGLPGNPFAAFAAFLALGRPLVQRLSGETVADPPRVTVRCGFAHGRAPGKREYLRVALRQEGGDTVAHLAGAGGSAALSSLAVADAVAEVEEARDSLRTGDPLTVIPLHGLF
ncbi:gephyrin-like molybdotransferase Glp [Nitrospirillum sp. BR 11164]|uniref:molybdopterin molybdotransferase MoeA n=1 Tax=Nitrospirillum sp. BR 11164 TaxID=3104324 RepID=UPI002AFFB088|nr:gephyrin-like molybdotransferase Glp [Nitrospirillum sp. BR 11164]MEA1651936.1 gephyrin-like molybdotransferase Glp [Nitrospirillum sp. BR 11164]